VIPPIVTDALPLIVTVTACGALVVWMDCAAKTRLPGETLSEDDEGG
jgi:hypothetical protein